MRRLFIAVGEGFEYILPETNKLKQVFAGEPIRWLDEKMHITLCFLGATHEMRIAELINTLRKVAREFMPLKVRVKGAGVFPSREAPRVLWLGVDYADADRLKELGKTVRKEMLMGGFAHETSEFIPHVTIGRFKQLPTRDFDYKLDSVQHIDCGTVTIKNLYLMESIIDAEGATHQLLETITLEKEDEQAPYLKKRPYQI